MIECSRINIRDQLILSGKFIFNNDFEFSKDVYIKRDLYVGYDLTTKEIIANAGTVNIAKNLNTLGINVFNSNTFCMANLTIHGDVGSKDVYVDNMLQSNNSIISKNTLTVEGFSQLNDVSLNTLDASQKSYFKKGIDVSGSSLLKGDLSGIVNITNTGNIINDGNITNSKDITTDRVFANNLNSTIISCNNFTGKSLDISNINIKNDTNVGGKLNISGETTITNNLILKGQLISDSVVHLVKCNLILHYKLKILMQTEY